MIFGIFFGVLPPHNDRDENSHYWVRSHRSRFHPEGRWIWLGMCRFWSQFHPWGCVEIRRGQPPRSTGESVAFQLLCFLEVKYYRVKQVDLHILEWKMFRGITPFSSPAINSLKKRWCNTTNLDKTSSHFPQICNKFPSYFHRVGKNIMWYKQKCLYVWECRKSRDANAPNLKKIHRKTMMQ